MQFFRSARFHQLALLAFWAAVLFSVTMALLPKPPRFAGDEFGDKFHHILAFAVMTALAMAAFPAAMRWRIAERLSFLGAMIEVAQSIPQLHRDCDIRDWIADTAAILVVTVLAAGIAYRRGARRQ